MSMRQNYNDSNNHQDTYNRQYPEENRRDYDGYDESRNNMIPYDQRREERRPDYNRRSDGTYNMDMRSNGGMDMNMDRKQSKDIEMGSYSSDKQMGYHRNGKMREGYNKGSDSTAPEHAFKEVLERQTIALKMHMDMANMFEFLGLKGFKMMHEYQLVEEGACYRKTAKHYLTHYNKMLEVEDVDFLDIIPRDWYRYTRFEVTPGVRKRAVIELFDEWKEWEQETKELYSHLATSLINNKHFVAGNYIGDLAKETAEEIKKLEKMYLELKTVEFDSVYVEGTQNKLYNTYKNKLKEVDMAY